ncbi:MAG: hypothetical protein U5K84_07270 [Alkalibacterium sp.]|nr:hypothetical protein [Alkalibacterium sp.]
MDFLSSYTITLFCLHSSSSISWQIFFGELRAGDGCHHRYRSYPDPPGYLIKRRRSTLEQQAKMATVKPVTDEMPAEMKETDDRKKEKTERITSRNDGNI